MCTKLVKTSVGKCQSIPLIEILIGTWVTSRLILCQLLINSQLIDSRLLTESCLNQKLVDCGLTVKQDANQILIKMSIKLGGLSEGVDQGYQSTLNCRCLFVWFLLIYLLLYFYSSKLFFLKLSSLRKQFCISTIHVRTWKSAVHHWSDWDKAHSHHVIRCKNFSYHHHLL